MTVAIDQQEYHPVPSKMTYTAGKIKGECSHLMRINLSKDLESAVIDDFTVFVPSLGMRIPLNHMALSRRVEILWKIAYDIAHPSADGNPSMLSLAELVRVMKLSKDLVNNTTMVNYLRIPQYDLWARLHDHVIKHRTLPLGMEPFTVFSQRDRVKRRSSVVSSHTAKRTKESRKQESPLTDCEQTELEEPCTSTHEAPMEVQQAAAVLEQTQTPQRAPQRSEAREAPPVAAVPLDVPASTNAGTNTDDSASMDHRIVEKALLLKRQEDQLAKGRAAIEKMEVQYREEHQKTEVILQNTREKQKEKEDVEGQLVAVQDKLLEAEVWLEVIRQNTIHEQKKMEDLKARVATVQQYVGEINKWLTESPTPPDEPTR